MANILSSESTLLEHRPGRLPPAALAHWLYNQDSLTQRLIAASGGEFRVQVLDQGFARPRPEERRMLGLKEREVALVREVLLLGHDQPWVFARSIVPLCTLAGRYRFLRHLASQPLGALLFNDPSMRRGDFELMPCTFADLGLSSRVIKHAVPDQALWGRRSLFYLGKKPLLVAETFLPSFIAQL